VTCDPASAAIAFGTPAARSVQVGEDVTTKCRLSREEVVERFRHPLLRLVLTMAESWFEHRSEIVFHDPLAAATVFHETLSTLSRGRIDIDPRGRTSFQPDDNGGHEVATHVNREAFFEVFFSAFD
jgi:purine nucleosidase